MSEAVPSCQEGMPSGGNDSAAVLYLRFSWTMILPITWGRALVKPPPLFGLDVHARANPTLPTQPLGSPLRPVTALPA
jgi:hypothetical protein